MAFTELEVIEISDSGIIVEYTPAAEDGNSFRNDFGAMLRVINSGAAEIDVTVKAQINCNHGFRHDLVVAIPNDDSVVEIGPFPNNRYLSRDGMVEVTYEDVTDVTVAVVRAGIS